jgi:hypothetical protein
MCAWIVVRSAGLSEQSQTRTMWSVHKTHQQTAAGTTSTYKTIALLTLVVLAVPPFCLGTNHSRDLNIDGRKISVRCTQD